MNAGKHSSVSPRCSIFWALTRHRVAARHGTNSGGVLGSIGGLLVVLGTSACGADVVGAGGSVVESRHAGASGLVVHRTEILVDPEDGSRELLEDGEASDG